MPTIKTAIQLYDGVTNPIQSMHRAMGILLNSFETMQRTSSKSIDVAAIRESREEWAKAGSALDEIKRNVEEADQAQKKFNNRIRQGTSAADSLWQKLKGVAVAIGAGTAVKNLVELSDSMTSTRARLNLIVDDGGSVAALENQIMASAQRSRASYLTTAQAVSQMGLMSGDAFSSNSELITFTEILNKQFAIAGTNAAGAEAATLQLTQAMASGVLRGEELNSVFEQAPNVIQSIADYMEIPIGQVRALAAEGQITADIVKNSMLAAEEAVNRDFESMPMTWGQIWMSMKNKALSIFAPILKRINEIGNSQRFAKVTAGVIGGLAAIASVATVVFDLLTSGISFVIDNWSWLAPIVGGVATAFLVLNGAMLAYKTVTGVVNALEAVKAARLAMTTVATGAQTTATFAQTAAQYGLNAALLACPLVWIILLIIAVVAVIYAACAAIAKFTGAANSGFGIVCGGVMVVIAFFQNLVLSIANVALGIWNALGACASNIGTAFHNVIANIQGWFYDLLSTALTVVSDICESLNKLPFVEFDYSGISNKANEYAAKSAAAYNRVEEYKSIADAFQKGMSTYDTFSDGWVESAFYKGVNWGDKVSNKISGLFDFSAMDSYGADDLMDRYGIGNTLDSIHNNTGDTAGNTAAMSDTLYIAEEDLKYMRDIAEREAINRYTTAEIKVEQQNTNYINQDLDLDGIMDAWANDFAEKLDISEEGVHQ